MFAYARVACERHTHAKKVPPKRSAAKLLTARSLLGECKEKRWVGVGGEREGSREDSHLLGEESSMGEGGDRAQ